MRALLSLHIHQSREVGTAWCLPWCLLWCLPWCLPWCSGSVGFIVAAAQENQSCTGFVSLVATGLLSPNAEGSKSLRRVCSGSDKEVVPPFHIIMNDSRLDVSGCF